MITGITYTDDTCLKIAQSLAESRDFVLSADKDPTIRFWLVVSKEGIRLEDTSSKIGALKIDFLSGSNLHRLHHSQGQREYLLRAIGKHPPKTTIVDATAGLASDGFMLAVRGFKVTLIEQNPVVATLLEDALARAYKDSEHGQMLLANLQLKIGNAQDILDNMPDKPEFIYLDPMYPKTDKSSLPTKSMQYLQKIVVPESKDDLLVNSLENVKKKVVVKRSKTASYLENINPSHQIFGKTTRYDIYLKSSCSTRGY